MKFSLIHSIEKNESSKDVVEGFPYDVDHMPGPTSKHDNNNCLTCHGRKVMYKLHGNIYSDNKQGSIKITCPDCHGSGDKQNYSKGYWNYALKKAEEDRRKREGKPYKKNPLSHDENGVYIGDKDLEGKPVPRLKEADEKARSDSTTSENSDLEKIASEATQITTGEVRFVLHLSKADLINQYLVAGGGKKIIETMSDEEIENFLDSTYGDAKNISRISKVDSKTPFSKAIRASKTQYIISNDATVIIDFPTSIEISLRKADGLRGTAGNGMNEVRKILTSIMDHKYYVLTINNGKATKLVDEINTAASQNIQELVQVFNPYIIMNYPIKHVLVGAQKEWGGIVKNKEKEQAESPSKKEKEESSSKPREAWPMPSGKIEDRPSAHPLSNEEMLEELKDLWTKWVQSGKDTDEEMRDYILKMWRHVKDIK